MIDGRCCLVLEIRGGIPKRLSVCVSVFLSVCLCVSLSVYLPVYIMSRTKTYHKRNRIQERELILVDTLLT